MARPHISPVVGPAGPALAICEISNSLVLVVVLVLEAWEDEHEHEHDYEHE